VTLVRRSDGRVRFLVRGDLEDVDEDIVEYGDEDDLAILCTDQYSIYDGIDEHDEHDEIDGHLVINHHDHYAVGDAHTNSCENRHSFFCNWLRRFRGVSKHHLQGYLNFFSLTLNTDRWFEEILSTYFYT
jgi:transposase-like protein